MDDDRTFDETDLRAAQAVISLEGWPSRSRADEWLARILRAGANQAAKMSSEAAGAERETCAKVADASKHPECDRVAATIRARGEG